MLSALQMLAVSYPRLDNGNVYVTIGGHDKDVVRISGWCRGLSVRPLVQHAKCRSCREGRNGALPARARQYSNVKPVGAGVVELRIDFGAGYRVYFGQDGPVLVILLAGGTKKRQQREIGLARKRWADYKRRKRAAR